MTDLELFSAKHLHEFASRVFQHFGVPTPDAIQAATALSAGARGLIGNDAGFKRITELEVLSIEDAIEK